MFQTKKSEFLLPVLATVLAGCGSSQYEFDTSRHITKETVSQEEPLAPSGVPDLVGTTAELPDLVYEGNDAVFDIIVDAVSVRSIFISLADQAQLDLDIDPRVDGVVSLNAYGQTLDQIFERIRKQLPIRYERIGETIVVMNDDLYYKQYQISFPNLVRTFTAAADGSASTSGSGSLGTSGITTSKTSSQNIWQSMEETLELLLANEYNAFAQNDVGAVPQQNDAATRQAVQEANTLKERTGLRVTTGPFAHLIPDAGLIIVYASSDQHKLVAEVIDKMYEASRRQVLLQATVVEIQLSNNYQQGIDWSIFNAATKGPRVVQSSVLDAGKVLSGPTQEQIEGLKANLESLAGDNRNQAAIDAAVQAFAIQRYTPTPAATGGFLSSSFTVGDLDVAVSLLDRFGDTKVVSSPRISTLNGQGAILKVVEDAKYFTVESETTREEGLVTTTVEVEEQTIPIGFVVSVYPQISPDGTIILSIRPSVSRVVGEALPPPVASQSSSGVPIISVKEIETLMLLRDGQTAVLGGLIEDVNTGASTGVPGLNKVPGVGGFFENKAESSKRVEYVIFVSAKIIKNPTLQGDYREYQDWLPSDETFVREQNSLFNNETTVVPRGK